MKTFIKPIIMVTMLGVSQLAVWTGIATQDAAATPSTTLAGINPASAHIINGEMLRRMKIDDAPLTTAAFSGKSFSIDKTVAGITSEKLTKYTSLATFQTALAANVHPAGSWVMYDIEGWDDTPMEDKIDPLTAMENFATAAHDANLYVIMAPSRDLAGVAGSPCRQQQGEVYNDSYLRCGLAAKAAEVGDVVEIQTQANQYDLTIFETFADAAIAQAEESSPATPIIIGLTTQRGDSAYQMKACWDLVKDDVQGYWLNTQIATLSVAEDFLTLTQNP